MDVSIPNGNEKEIMEMAKLLGTKEMCLLYSAGKKAILPELLGIKSVKAVIANSGEMAFIREADLEQNLSRNFLAIMPDLRYPYKNLQSINLKRIKGNPALCIPFSLFLQSQNSAVVWQAAKRMISLWRKAKRPFILGSFASNPYELRNMSDLESFYRVLGLRTNEVRTGFDHLSEHLS